MGSALLESLWMVAKAVGGPLAIFAVLRFLAAKFERYHKLKG